MRRVSRVSIRLPKKEVSGAGWRASTDAWTPNGQAAFLLTSALAPLIRLSSTRMVLLALPYTVIMTVVGLLAVKEIL
ncbi:MAG: hypothetical protein HKM98_09820 [Gammaproteobacteria bacterium]|nr:hypothetical protein [Gammaproteobacteria bacterium]